MIWRGCYIAPSALFIRLRVAVKNSLPRWWTAGFYASNGEQIARFEAAPNVETAILVCVESMVNTLENTSPIYLRDLWRFPPGERTVRRTLRQITDALTRTIERGKRENVFRKIEPRVVAEALLASVRRMIEPDFLAGSSVTSAEAVRQVYQIFWFGSHANHKDSVGVRLPRYAPKRLEAAEAIKL